MIPDLANTSGPNLLTSHYFLISVCLDVSLETFVWVLPIGAYPLAILSVSLRNSFFQHMLSKPTFPAQVLWFGPLKIIR